MKNYSKFFGLFFLWFLLTGLFLGIAVADDDDDEDDDGVDDDLEEHNKRELKVEIEEDQIEIASELRGGSVESSFEIKIKLEEDDGLEIKVKYESSGDDDDDDDDEDEVETSSDGIEFEIIIHSITEFVDVDADGIFDPAVDTQIKELLLNSFNTPEHSKKDIEGEEGKLHKIEVTSTDGVFTLRFFIAESFTEVSGDTLTPTEIKFDIEINNFVYDNGSSQLALMVILESEDDYEHDDDTHDEDEGHSDDEEGVEIKSGGEQGFFTWKDTAEIDGTTKPVLTSDLTSYEDDEDEQKLYLNYERGTNILHDPKIGIAASLVEEGPLNIWAIVLIVGVVGAIGVIIWLVKKDR